MKVVFLWSETGSYLHSQAKSIYKFSGQNVSIVNWDKRGSASTLFKNFEEEGVTYLPRSSFSNSSLLDFLLKESPDIIVVSGWMDLGYLLVCRKYKKKSKVKVLAAIDDNWHGTFRQYIGRYVYRLFMDRKIFDYMWVAGSAQLYYATKFGLSFNKIIPNCLSASDSFYIDQVKLMKRFVFVGRFLKRKGIITLIKAHKMLDYRKRKEWPLVLIGDTGIGGISQYKDDVLKEADEFIIFTGSLQPAELVQELKKGGVGCVPSTKEPFGLVVHEFCKMGMPIILSSEVGATSEFLISGYNGYNFESENIESLHNSLMKIINLTESELLEFCEHSHLLSNRISSEISASVLLSIISN
ncbi:MAG: glycosyltransferase [Bacteroidetes bacterium]|nr:glycosyltransferase [Bacteroidota bacterium]